MAIADHLRLNAVNNVPRTSVLDATMVVNPDVVGIAEPVVLTAEPVLSAAGESVLLTVRRLVLLTAAEPVLFMVGGLVLSTAREPVLLTAGGAVLTQKTP